MTSLLPGLVGRLPAWLRQELPDNKTVRTLQLLSSFDINTVCQQAHCPNLTRCFKSGRLTFLILGKRCSRDCLFCAMEKNRGGNLGIDNSEPEKIARMVESLGLGYVVITSVTRDDLVDGGVAQFCRTLELIHALGKDIKIELLIPDFNANPANLRAVVAARPRVIGHNIETVARLHRELKPSCDYCISLKVLSMIKTIEPAMLTKSSILLGLGEKEEEIISTLRDLREAGCDMVVLGQYLSPSKQHYPVREFVAPEKFRSYQNQAAALGFKTVISSPLARSSYRAEELYEETLYA